MQRTIWLIRHGQSEGNRDNIIQGHFDANLSNLGIEQSKNTAVWFQENQSNLQIQAIFSSDLKRAYDTVKPIAQILNLEIHKNSDWREAYFGKWEGRKASEIELEDPENFKRWKSEKKWRPDWCENFEQLQSRSLKALKYSINNSQGNILIASHGGLIYSLLYRFAPNRKILIHNCGISRLILSNEQIQIEDISFLAPNVEISPEMKHLMNEKNKYA